MAYVPNKLLADHFGCLVTAENKTVLEIFGDSNSLMKHHYNKNKMIYKSLISFNKNVKFLSITE